jgi:hypothetical protein
MTISKRPYSVNNITEAQKIAFDLKDNFRNTLTGYEDDPIRQLEMIEGFMKMGYYALSYIYDNLDEIGKDLSKEYTDSIIEAFEYLDANVDNRLLGNEDDIE